MINISLKFINDTKVLGGRFLEEKCLLNDLSVFLSKDERKDRARLGGDLGSEETNAEAPIRCGAIVDVQSMKSVTIFRLTTQCG